MNLNDAKIKTDELVKEAQSQYEAAVRLRCEQLILISRLKRDVSDTDIRIHQLKVMIDLYEETLKKDHSPDTSVKDSK